MARDELDAVKHRVDPWGSVNRSHRGSVTKAYLSTEPSTPDYCKT